MDEDCELVYQESVRGVMRKKLFVLLTAAALSTVGGCARTDASQPLTQEEEMQTESEDVTDTPDKDEMSDELPEASVSARAAWCIYWDANSAQAAAENMAVYDELILFGCIYEEDHTLHIPEALQQLYGEFPKPDQETQIYLSFINDVMQEDGTAQQKSPVFLEEVLRDDALVDRLIDDMVSQTKEWGLDGIELDYENVQKGEDLWNDYLRFVSRLYERTQQEGLLLRVVLGAYTPVEEYEFIPGPQYVVMCYNLYGTHSGPGPKADEAFLKEMVERYEGMEVTFAIANGGFEWDDQGKAVRSVTAGNARKLAKENGVEPVQDASGALYYTYEAEDGQHTVWYGDDDTMRRWEEWLVQYSGHDIMVNLWRLE